MTSCTGSTLIHIDARPGKGNTQLRHTCCTAAVIIALQRHRAAVIHRAGKRFNHALHRVRTHLDAADRFIRCVGWGSAAVVLLGFLRQDDFCRVIQIPLHQKNEYQQYQRSKSGNDR